MGFLFITILVLFIFIDMAIKYGIDFPFRDSQIGDFVKMTETPEREVRANLIHLLLTDFQKKKRIRHRKHV